MSEFLRALEAIIDELPRLLSPGEWEAMKAELMPLLERYRASGDPRLIEQILAVFRNHPAAERLLPQARYRPDATGEAAAASDLAEPAEDRSDEAPAGFGIDDLTRSGFKRAAPPPRATRAAPPRRAAAGPPPSPAPPPTAAAPRPAGRGTGRARAGAAPSRAAARGGERAARPKRKRAQPDRAQPRWVLARVFDLSGGARPAHATGAYRAKAEHEVEVMIGTEQADWLIARGPSADDSIDAMLPRGETHELSVAFIIPALGVNQMGKLTLPPTGPTPEPATFRFTAPAADTPIEALINVIHRGRILQTAILSGRAVADPAAAPADAALKLRLQIVVPGLGDLDRRETFDATMVVARHPDGHAMAAAVPDAAPGAAPIVLFDQPGLNAAVDGIRGILDRFLDDPAIFRDQLDSRPSVDLMRRLANAGVTLHHAIGEKLLEGLPGRDLTRLQVVQVDPTAFIPVEFVYDLPAPANDAGLCPNWRKALEGKPCTPAHHAVDEVLGDLKVVCPSGFWSVSKVIERQVVRQVEAADLRGNRFGIRAEPTAQQSRLAPPRAALFAWSERLDNKVPGTSGRMLKSLRTAAGQAIPVKTWRDWATTIKQRRPSLLVLLSHTTDEAPPSLEIGPDGDDRPERAERRALGQLNDKLIRASLQDAPVLFLLGCDTAVADRQLYSFVAGFRDSGAAVVVGTITPVHGELAAAVVETLVERLAAAARRQDVAVRFGELMRDGRRMLLKGGKLTALSVASFGDADWLVGGKGA
jgi:hypothetical protein